MAEMSEVVDGSQARGSAPGPEGLRCDFCHAVVPSVRRIALDQGYERLRTAHRERFACPACSDRKERERLARA